MSDKKPERRGLGRGLSALMADVAPAAADSATGEPRPRRPDLTVPVERIRPNPDQPRRDFDRDALEELAESIRAKGVIQPLIVRPDPGSAGNYEIVAGERRWRAAQIAQLHEVPVLVRDFSDTEVLEVAIIENIQRADLNPVEEAMAYRQLMDRFGHTQEKLAEGLSKSRSHIANIMRLLQLPDGVLTYLREGKLTAGHARALITTGNPEELARKIIAKGLSVREAERLAKAPPKGSPRPRGATAEKDADTRALEQDLSANLGMKVQIDHRSVDGDGTLTLHYRSLEQLDELCRILSVSPLDVSR
ncbi:chromosome partitioning protein ParB [Defluviimonas sp. 20V17]|uniref:Chromosome segregation DNA-binding protein n=1 Tax=Allgaiera indica TaxID=765699 RepID=A0AAN4UND2_9RHOB|nr:ParB/RepB/Spo0J family partition protein [Allgaiera indica]KDB03634.1 chromosome partitioning protein ParB [Defluviimonas sp. 20V17]GHD98242.1 chromosome segregation DNA-binding protein [Allgaiera indica]SDW50929.1 chromosome segregation DNA-binding protein [Allgaiera indica]